MTLGVLLAAVGIVAVAVFSPALALRSIEVSGTQRIPAADIEDALAGELGTPLALLDERRVADELGDFALIRSFVVELVPPDTMRVEIVEREPIGVVVSGAVFQLVDPAGVVIESTAARPEGVPLLELPAGDEGRIREAVAEVLLALPADVLTRVDRITATTRDDVAFSLRDSEQRVVWGAAEDSARKADVLAVLLQHHAGAGPGEYDVSAPRTAVFRAS